MCNPCTLSCIKIMLICRPVNQFPPLSVWKVTVSAKAIFLGIFSKATFCIEHNFFWKLDMHMDMYVSLVSVVSDFF